MRVSRSVIGDSPLICFFSCPVADTPDDVFGDKKQAAVAKALTTKRLVDPETGLTILQKVAARQTLTRSERATKAMQSKRSKIDSQTGVSVLQSIGIKTGARLALEGTFDPTIEVSDGHTSASGRISEADGRRDCRSREM